MAVDKCGRVHTYVFSADAGHRVNIEMTRAEKGDVNPRLELYDSQGRAIILPGSGSIVFSPTATGLFTLLAFSAQAEVGTYHLSLEMSATDVKPTTWGRVKVLYR